MSEIQINDITGNDNSYEVFKEKLNAVEKFPCTFVFKFIIPGTENGKEKLEKIYKGSKSKFSSKNSSGGKYESFTIETFVKNADEVIAFYKEASKIEKIIIL